jgi:hypothetical protein
MTFKFHLWPIIFLLAFKASWAQPSQPDEKNEIVSPKVQPLIEAAPAWSELTASEKKALEPLHKTWPYLSQIRKKKWLAISAGFPELSTEEQEKLQGRMKEWVKLSPRERAQARMMYAQVKQIHPDQRKKSWEAYQALSEDEKSALSLSHPKATRSAAIALQPVAVGSRNASSKPSAASGFSALHIDTDLFHPVTLLPLKDSGHHSP